MSIDFSINKGDKGDAVFSAIIALSKDAEVL